MAENDLQGDLLISDGDNQEAASVDNPDLATNDADTAQDVATDQPEGWKDDVQLSKFKTVSDLEKAYKNLETKLGADTVKIPGENASDEEWAVYYKKIGRPDTPDGYELEEGNAPEALAEFRTVCHDAGLSTRQAEKLWSITNGKAQAQVADIQKQNAARRDEWKAQTTKMIDGDVTYLPIAKKGAKALGEDFTKLLKDFGLGSHPVMVKVAHEYGVMTSEDSLETGTRGGSAKPKPGDPDFVWTYPNSPALQNR